MRASSRLLLFGQHGFDYWVNGAAGNDALDGKTEATAVQHFSALPTLRDGVRIKYVGYSRQNWFPTVKFTLIGDGVTSILDSSDVISSGSWTKTGGRTNVYQVDISPDLQSNGKTWVNVWENDTFMVRVADEATCDSTANSYCPSSDTTLTGGVITLKIHTSDGTSPIVNGKTYEFSSRRAAVYATTIDDCWIEGITAIKSLGNEGNIYGGKRCTLRNLTFRGGNKHNWQTGESPRWDGVVSYTPYYGPNADTLHASTHGVAYEDFPAGGNGDIRNITLVQADLNPSVGGLIIHSSDSTLYKHGDITITNLNVTGCNVGMDYRASHAITLVNPIFTNCAVGTRPGGVSGTDVPPILTVTGMKFNNTITAAQVKAIDMPLAGAVVSVDGLLCCVAAPHSAGLLAILQNTTLVCTNATFAISGTPGTNKTILVVAANKTANITLTGNKYGSAFIRVLSIPSSVTLTIVTDNNFFGASGLRNNINGTDNLTMAAYLAANPTLDVHSFVGTVDVSAACA